MFLFPQKTCLFLVSLINVSVIKHILFAHKLEGNAPFLHALRQYSQRNMNNNLTCKCSNFVQRFPLRMLSTNLVQQSHLINKFNYLVLLYYLAALHQIKTAYSRANGLCLLL